MKLFFLGGCYAAINDMLTEVHVFLSNAVITVSQQGCNLLRQGLP
jgi:hypothetical protein